MNLAMKSVGTGAQRRQTFSCAAFDGDIEDAVVGSHRVLEAVVICHTRQICALHVTSNGKHGSGDRDLTSSARWGNRRVFRLPVYAIGRRGLSVGRVR